MKSKNVEMDFEAWLKDSGAPDDNFMFSYLVKGCMFEAWQASRERYVPKPAKDAGYGCHCDLDPGMKPDGCVIDMGALRNCVYAEKLIDAGKSRDDCEYWQPIVVVTPNGGNES